MDTREKIIHAALDAFSASGSKGATTRAIADAADVNEVTLFRHFRTKSELLAEALRHAADRLPSIELPPEPTDPRAELESWCREHLDGMYAARSLLRASIAESEVSPEAEALASRVPVQVAEDLRRYAGAVAATRGVDLVGERTAAAVSMLMGALLTDAISRDLMPKRYPYSLDSAARLYADLFLHSLNLDRP